MERRTMSLNRINDYIGKIALEFRWETKEMTHEQRLEHAQLAKYKGIIAEVYPPTHPLYRSWWFRTEKQEKVRRMLDEQAKSIQYLV